MPRKGFLDPKNFVESSGGGSFKEGNVRIDSSAFRVHHADVPVGQKDRGAITALVWGVTRLDDDLQPLLDAATDEPITEELVFGAGGKSLVQIHPGTGSGPEDEDVEDLGNKDGTEGNTLFFINDDFSLNNKSSLGLLMMSLGTGRDKHFKGVHYASEFMGRVWAPDWIGHVFHMKTWLDQDNKISGNDGVERPIPYKTVTAILKTPGEKGQAPAAAGASGGAKALTTKVKKTAASAPAAEVPATPAAPAEPVVKAAKNGKVGPSEEVEDAVALVLNSVSEGAAANESISVKVFYQKASAMMDVLKIDGKLKLPIMTECYKNKDWMRANAERFDMRIDQDKQTVTFGPFPD